MQYSTILILVKHVIAVYKLSLNINLVISIIHNNTLEK
jgi:hypothetical protein